MSGKTMNAERFCATIPAGNTNGWMLWHYQTSDEFAEIALPHYFAEVANLVRDGDWIAVNLMNSLGLGYHPRLLIVQSVNDNEVYVERVALP